VAGLVERGMCGLGLDDVRPVDASELLGVVAVGDHGVEDAARAAGGHDAGWCGVAGGITVQEVEGHRDDLGLELGLAGAHVALERVDVREPAECLGQERVVLVIAAVHGAGALAGLPEGVLLLGHRAELGEDLVAGHTVFGQLPVDRVAVLVGERAHTLHATDGAHPSAPLPFSRSGVTYLGLMKWLTPERAGRRGRSEALASRSWPTCRRSTRTRSSTRRHRWPTTTCSAPIAR